MHIRNFVIISHIDHGKSTLADRFLELTGTVPKNKMREQYLDMMELERERGITIKMQPVRMNYVLHSEAYILNLVDTPGHVDFSYEVSRALAAVEGAILLVDATKGIQAQTLANLELAKKQNLVIVPAVNKIDLPNARVQETAAEVAALLSVSEKDIIAISGKDGTNVEQLLHAVIKRVPAPVCSELAELRALVFDSKYDSFKGVVAYVRVTDGEIKKGQKIFLAATKKEGEAKEVGYFIPQLAAQETLSAGEIGYIATGIKEPGGVRVGDTITFFPAGREVQPLPGYKEPKPVVFASFYPEDASQHDELKVALTELKLQDPAFMFEPESQEALGRGFRCGFLGTLHMEIVSERLRREFHVPLVVSSPSVMYKIINKKGEERWVYSASEWPDRSYIQEIQEPWVQIEILTSSSYLGRITELLGEFPGKYLERKHLGYDASLSEKIIIAYEMPLREMIKDFYGKLKGATQGYASMNYEMKDWRAGNLVKLEILVAGKKEEPFSRIVPESQAFFEGRALTRQLKEVIPPQQFSVALQACLGGKVIARETIRSAGKDVIAPLYGGDYTRKRKLLEKQKKGKKELKARGEVRIPQRVFLEIIKKR